MDKITVEREDVRVILKSLEGAYVKAALVPAYRRLLAAVEAGNDVATADA